MLPLGTGLASGIYKAAGTSQLPGLIRYRYRIQDIGEQYLVRA